MRAKLLVYLLYVAICLPSLAVGSAMTYYLSRPSVPQVVRAPEYVPDQPPGSVVKLVGVTPDGTRVYRVEGPDMIVPAVLAVSSSGQVAFR